MQDLSAETFRQHLLEKYSLPARARARVEIGANSTLSRPLRERWEATDLSAAEFADEVSDYFGVVRLGLPQLLAATPCLDGFSRRFLRESTIFPLRAPNGSYRLAVADPSDTAAVRAAEIVFGEPVEVAVASFEDITTVLDVRIATMPPQAGESAVIRLLPRDRGLLEMGKLGLSTRDEAIMTRLLALPHGMIVVTGPTGSGKTTTLATMLSILNEPTRKILTIEDPVEYEIPGVNQSQVKPSIGLTFASAMRSFVRQDPDVIMVGEIRDAETAHIAIHAALTGHLVLTTL